MTKIRADRLGVSEQFMVLITAGFAVMAAPRIRTLLPERFVWDGQLIQNLAITPRPRGKTNSFDSVAAVYRTLGLSHSPDLVALLSVVLFIAVVFACVGLSEVARFGGAAAIIYMMVLTSGTVYLAQFSKEVITLVLIAPLVIRPRSKWPEIVFILAALAYATFIRPYWFIVLALYIFWRLTFFKITNPAVLAGAIIAAYVALEFGFMWSSGGSLASIRAELNEYRPQAHVDSMILPLLPLHGFMAGPGYFTILLSLVVPVPLLFDGGLFHVLSAGVIGFSWLCAAIGYWRLASIDTIESHRDHLALRALPLLLALVMVQAVFEPDYGSYLKHITPLLPLFLTVVPLRQLNPAVKSSLTADVEHA